MRSQIERRAIYNSFAAGLMVVLGLSLTASAQSLREKLNQQTDYQIQAGQPDQQLIEVARRFQIPMAIEWLDQANNKTAKLNFERGTVLELIRAIVDQAPQQKLAVERRVILIYAPSAFSNRLNFLNLKLKGYCVSDETVYGASFALRVRIDHKLYPEYFKHGWNGGYGGTGDLMHVKRINICARHVSIRRVLTTIAAQSGQAGWIVKLEPEELRGNNPFWTGVPVNEYGTSPLSGRWHFFELREPDR